MVNSLVLKSPTASVGLLYRGDLIKRGKRDDKGLRYLIGVAAELPARVSARRTELVSTFTSGTSGLEIPADTARFIDGRMGHLILPIQLSIGITVLDPQWRITVEHRRRDWDKLRVDVADYSMRSELGTQASYNLAAAYRPAGDDRGTFWTRTTYRAGLRYMDQYLIVNGVQLNEMAASAGLSLPLMSSTTRSHLHLGVEWSRNGTTDQGLMRQELWTLFVGVAITPDLREQWLRKRRIE